MPAKKSGAKVMKPVDLFSDPHNLQHDLTTFNMKL
jgi:hypothetical protein